MIDYNDYVGIPWVCGQATKQGADCWGIVTMVLKAAFGVRLGHYCLSNINSQRKAIKTFQKEMRVELNSGNWLKCDIPRELDVVMMFSRSSGRPDHVGVYISNNMILHSMTREIGISEVHHIKLIKPMFKRLEYYRYVGQHHYSS